MAICRFLIYNSRMSYSELAKVLDISVQAAYRRVQGPVSAGTIGGFRANFSGRAYRSIWVMVRGRSDASSVNEVMDRLGKDKDVDMMMLTSGKGLMIIGAVRDPAKLDKLVSFATKTAELVDPEIDIVHLPLLDGTEGEPPIYPLDVKLVELLMDDSRRPTTELARNWG